ncbi:hypothetical protein EDD15DRAFT_2202947 [Pisolithus albus]|nr:hypothetical protein EDD15DRAFT_2202947 [Pisolithus albus]
MWPKTSLSITASLQLQVPPWATKSPTVSQPALFASLLYCYAGPSSSSSGWSVQARKMSGLRFICAVNIINHKVHAVKLELCSDGESSVEREYHILKELEGGLGGEGIPHAHWFGRESTYDALVLDLLGPSLHDLLLQYQMFSLSTVVALADQLSCAVGFQANSGPSLYIAGWSQLPTVQVEVASPNENPKANLPARRIRGRVRPKINSASQIGPTELHPKSMAPEPQLPLQLWPEVAAQNSQLQSLQSPHHLLLATQWLFQSLDLLTMYSRPTSQVSLLWKHVPLVTHRPPACYRSPQLVDSNMQESEYFNINDITDNGDNNDEEPPVPRACAAPSQNTVDTVNSTLTDPLATGTQPKPRSAPDIRHFFKKRKGEHTVCMPCK